MFSVSPLTHKCGVSVKPGVLWLWPLLSVQGFLLLSLQGQADD